MPDTSNFKEHEKKRKENVNLEGGRLDCQAASFIFSLPSLPSFTMISEQIKISSYIYVVMKALFQQIRKLKMSFTITRAIT